MNTADRMEMEAGLMANLASWMESHGTLISDRQRSNAYTGIRIREICWKGCIWRVIEVDGMACRIERA